MLAAWLDDDVYYKSSIGNTEISQGRFTYSFEKDDELVKILKCYHIETLREMLTVVSSDTCLSTHLLTLYVNCITTTRPQACINLDNTIASSAVGDLLSLDHSFSKIDYDKHPTTQIFLKIFGFGHLFRTNCSLPIAFKLFILHSITLFFKSYELQLIYILIE